MKNGQVLFSDEVDKFKKWAFTCPLETRSGEWECDYDGWQDLIQSFNSFILSTSPSIATKQDISNLIYIIARDNEMEELVSELGDKSAWFKKLLPYVLESDEFDAKWQFAVELGNKVIPVSEAESALLKLVKDKEEYVSRRALQSLGKIGSSKTEYFCERAWESKHEYQRIMTLWVLKETGSSKLTKYISLAKVDGRKYLVHNAIEVENA